MVKMSAAAAPACALHAPEASPRCSTSCCQADGGPRSPFESPFSAACFAGPGLPPPPSFPGAITHPPTPAGSFSLSTSAEPSCLPSDPLSMTSSLFALTPLPLPALNTLSTGTFSATSTCTPFSINTSGASFSSSSAAAADTTLLLDTPASHPAAHPYRLLHPALGRGSYGCVYACDCQGQLVAAKVFHDKPDALTAWQRELHHLALANATPHPCVTALISAPCPGVILQSYAPNGTLDAYLYSSTPSEHLRINQLALARVLPPTHPLMLWPCPARASHNCRSACTTCGNAVWRLTHACCAAEYAARLSLLLSLAAALHHLHTLPCQSLIHRDVKPENVLIGSNGEGILSDFGLAVAVAGPVAAGGSEVGAAAAATTSSRPMTTPQYAAPEDLDCESRHGLSTASDCYSWGVVLWEVVSGSRPWADLPHPACAVFHVGERGARLEVPADWPAALRRLLLRCFSDPAGRPSSQELMLEISLELQRVVGWGVS